MYGFARGAASAPRPGVPTGSTVSLKGWLSPPVSAWLLSERRLQRRRDRAERARRASGQPHRVLYFHQPDDPYSTLAAAALPTLVRRYDVELSVRVVGPPADAAAPERARLADWARVDAARLARRHRLSLEDPGAPPPVRPGTAEYVAAAEALRARLGHYLGATFHYAGEWYWGIDRLHHLERRLQALGAARPGTDGVMFPPALDEEAGEPAGYDALDPAADASGGGPAIDFWFSVRSPYSAIAAPRMIRLARRHGATLRLRGLLPMVMRGLPVPAAKRRYIATDAAREARLHGVPFGRVVDPVGRPAERGLAVMAHARRKGRGEAMLVSLMQGVWAEGIDAGTDRGLRRIAERAGLDWTDCRDALADGDWRAQAERDRLALFERGLWGVPSFAVGDVAAWGQDRLWTIRDALATQGGAR